MGNSAAQVQAAGSVGVKHTSTQIRVAVVDDHPLVLAGVQAWVKDAGPGLRVEFAVRTWSDLLCHPSFPVDVVLLDLDLHDGIPAALKIATLNASRVAVVMISAFGETLNIRECLAAGALAFVPKSETAEELVEAVTRAAVGESYLSPAVAAVLVPDESSPVVPALSPQEQRALMLYASGLPMKSVALRMSVAFDTAKCYIDRVREKYAIAGREARTKIELRQRAVEDGLLRDR
jgi:two-component system uhpT operon response regulator UhpA